MIQTKPMADCHTPAEALDELCAPFAGYAGQGAGVSKVAPEQMPETYRALLVHNRHMTLTLREFHHSAVSLTVAEYRQDGPFYSRKIFLTTDRSPLEVEHGVVRLDMRYLPEAAGKEILGRAAPLGQILTNHNILRRIEPRWYVHLPAGCGMLRWLGRPVEGPFYGRIGTIFCNNEPAIELLEVVTLWDASGGARPLAKPAGA